jgi:hypothetical protein
LALVEHRVLAHQVRQPLEPTLFFQASLRQVVGLVVGVLLMRLALAVLEAVAVQVAHHPILVVQELLGKVLLVEQVMMVRQITPVVAVEALGLLV